MTPEQKIERAKKLFRLADEKFEQGSEMNKQVKKLFYEISVLERQAKDDRNGARNLLNQAVDELYGPGHLWDVNITPDEIEITVTVEQKVKL